MQPEIQTEECESSNFFKSKLSHSQRSDMLRNKVYSKSRSKRAKLNLEVQEKVKMEKKEKLNILESNNVVTEVDNAVNVGEDESTREDHQDSNATIIELQLTEKEEHIFNFLCDVLNRAADCHVIFKDRPRTQLLYCCGGWVRDKLLKKESKDIDLILSVSLFDYFEYRLLEEADMPVRRLERVAQDMDILRFDYEDVQIDVRALEGLLADDSLTRDFTINSVYYDVVCRKIVDPGGFVEDILNKRVRGCQELDKVFLDKNRYVRYVRQIKTLGLKPDDAIEEYVRKNAAAAFQTISINERRRYAIELRKILVSKQMSQILMELAEKGMFDYFYKDFQYIKLMTKYLARIYYIMHVKNTWKKLESDLNLNSKSTRDWIMVLAICYFFFPIRQNVKARDPFSKICSCFFAEGMQEKLTLIFTELSNLTKGGVSAHQRPTMIMEYVMKGHETCPNPEYIILAIGHETDEATVNGLLETLANSVVVRESYHGKKRKYINEEDGWD